MASELTTVEQTALVRCEAEIEEGKSTFIKVGNALSRIKAEKLYRASHSTFESYCQERWGWSRVYTKYVRDAAEAVANIADVNNCEHLPETESQVRPLTKLPKTEQARAWADAVASSPTGKPTAKEVEQVVQERINKPTPEPRFVCRHCYGNELTDDGECCARCKEPVTLPERKPRFAVAAARKKLFRALDDLMATWPEDQHAAFCDACLDYANERKDASQ